MTCAFKTEWSCGMHCIPHQQASAYGGRGGGGVGVNPPPLSCFYMYVLCMLFWNPPPPLPQRDKMSNFQISRPKKKKKVSSTRIRLSDLKVFIGAWTWIAKYTIRCSHSTLGKTSATRNGVEHTSCHAICIAIHVVAWTYICFGPP